MGLKPSHVRYQPKEIYLNQNKLTYLP